MEKGTCRITWSIKTWLRRAQSRDEGGGRDLSALRGIRGLNNDNMLSMLVEMFQKTKKKSVRSDRHHVNLHE